ncbi:phosphoglucosamine mutase [Candidatus Endomicrobiellum devescovinae]|jgi:phosphoglucosamine mutase|uniref:phosphoglucosamine mutase n=1 Tax=Candidatus Endomicrobiellum devescovinae TaxID=3242322 RepID=UPI002825A5FA|nr:phosphoglucosamine mutase [Endomicrobium sp.]
MKIFGTDGIRGDSSKFPFDNTTLNIIGRSIAEVLGANKRILIIRDTREPGKRIQAKLSEGMSANGAKMVFGSIMPTPAASLLVKNGNYCAAVVISASHNTYTDNGIKIFNSNGYKLSCSIEEKIEAKINKYITSKDVLPIKKVSLKENSKLIKFYENFIIENFSGKKLKGKTIILDCAHGASYKCAPRILKKLGARVIALNISPDGKNINLNCGALHPQSLCKAVKEYNAFCGFAFDGDADRLICVDENGMIRDGDYFLSSMSIWLKSKKKLKNNILVSTVMANIGLFRALKKEKIKVISSKVGDRYVIEDMKKHKASLGGEQSGHFIFKDILATGDGILSSVMILSALSSTGKTMSEFMNVIEKFPQILVNRKVMKKVPLEKLSKSYNLIKACEKSLGSDGRVLVRYSGTENLLRVMVEGKDIDEIKNIAESIADAVEKETSLQ